MPLVLATAPGEASGVESAFFFVKFVDGVEKKKKGKQEEGEKSFR